MLRRRERPSQPKVRSGASWKSGTSRHQSFAVSRSFISTIPDPRVERTQRHELADILVIAICGLLCRGETFNDLKNFRNAKLEWFKTFLKLPNGIPSHEIFNRVFAAVDPGKFLEVWLGSKAGGRPFQGRLWPWMAKALRRALSEGQNL